jgi:hypothetical protein
MGRSHTPAPELSRHDIYHLPNAQAAERIFGRRKTECHIQLIENASTERNNGHAYQLPAAPAAQNGRQTPTG